MAQLPRHNVRSASRLETSKLLRRSAWVVIVLAVCATTAWSSGIAQPTSSNLIALDATVGLAFVVAAASSKAPIAQRGWMVAVGLAWPLGVLSATRLLHSALLLVALAAFPSGRLRRPWQFLVAVLALLVGLQLLNQLAIAASFGFCAVCSAMAWRRRKISTPYAALAAFGVSCVLGTAWFLAHFRPERFRPSETVVAYEVVLLLVAVWFAVAVRADALRRATLADRLVADAGPSGVRGLEAVLRDLLHDPKLRIRTPGADPGGAGARILRIGDDLGPLAEVVHDSSSLDDPGTSAAVSEAVRLTLIQERRLAELAQRVADLETARIRIVSSRDRQRERAALTLRNDLQSLDSTSADIDRVRGNAAGESASVLDVVHEQIAATSREIADLVAGVPPTELGGGRLHAALEELAERTPLLTSLTVEAHTEAGVNEETALYYVCLEVLTNAVKHARASSVEISLRRVGTVLTMTVRDDGSGGADPTGAGLQGLADRLGTYSGRLQLRSTPGAGTTVIATIPLTQSSSRA